MQARVKLVHVSALRDWTKFPKASEKQAGSAAVEAAGSCCCPSPFQGGAGVSPSFSTKANLAPPRREGPGPGGRCRRGGRGCRLAAGGAAGRPGPPPLPPRGSGRALRRGALPPPRAAPPPPRSRSPPAGAARALARGGAALEGNRAAPPPARVGVSSALGAGCPSVRRPAGPPSGRTGRGRHFPARPRFSSPGSP